jgi:hypothetical protein
LLPSPPPLSREQNHGSRRPLAGYILGRRASLCNSIANKNRRRNQNETRPGGNFDGLDAQDVLRPERIPRADVHQECRGATGASRMDR